MKKFLMLAAFIAVGLASIHFFKGYSQMNCTINTPQDVVRLFPNSPEEINVKSNEAINLLNRVTKDIIDTPSKEKTFANTFKKLDTLNGKLTVIISPIRAMENLSPDKAMRDTAHEATIKVSDVAVEKTETNRELYLALKDYVENNMAHENLSDQAKYLINEIMSSYRRMGLDLPDEKLKQVSGLMQDINKLSLEFSKNINQDNSFILVEKDELQGVPENIVNSLEVIDGKYKLKADYPTVLGVLDYCKNQETRKKVYILFNNRANPQNAEILRDLIVKRDQLAKILGFESYAALDLDSEMAQNPEIAEEFISQIIKRAEIKAKEEIAELLKYVQEKDLLSNDGKIKPWNSRYIKNAYKNNVLGLDEKLVSEYFSLETTLPELLNIYEQFFGLKFKEVKASGLWHSDVRMLEVFDHDNKSIAYILLDLHPRDNKYSHAAQSTIVPAVKGGGKAVALVMANFPKPTKDNPALLTFNDVNTFFHEFGHALHAILGRTQFYSTSGTNVKTDFVEMPSQMLENWLKDEEILDKVSKHYKTDQKLPKELIRKLVELEKFDSGDMILRQLYFAKFSLRCFNENPDEDIKDIAKELHGLLRSHIEWCDEDNHHCSFGHLTDYGAKYYGYMWSKVFSSDLFNKIKKNGLLNPEIGQEYLEKVISKGGSQNPNELIEDFLGRKPSPEAFFEASGL